jgi:archaeosine synthase
MTLTRFFEVTKRDGPARAGKLMMTRPLATPCFIGPDLISLPGDGWLYKTDGKDACSPERCDEGTCEMNGCAKGERIEVLPYLPGPFVAADYSGELWQEKLGKRVGPCAAVQNPPWSSRRKARGSELPASAAHSTINSLQAAGMGPDAPISCAGPEVQGTAAPVVTSVRHADKAESSPDVYIPAGCGNISTGRDLFGIIAGFREAIPPDAALFLPAMASPSNMALLTYLGADIVDQLRMESDACYGRYHTREGAFLFSGMNELPCTCESCRKLQEAIDEGKAGLARLGFERTSALLADHNRKTLTEELIRVRELIRRESIREYLEGQIRHSPDHTACLRVMDQEEAYLERRTPTLRHSTLYANCSESLGRVEVKRFASRVLNRYRSPVCDVLLLLPCSAKKPYSTSRSHRIFSTALEGRRRFVHEVILTSPLALVPRELEVVYPASSYDVPVTGRWDLEERSWLLMCLLAFLKRNSYRTIVAHLEGELLQTVMESGIDAIFTKGGTSDAAVSELDRALDEACIDARRAGNEAIRKYRARADYFFGEGAGEALVSGKPIVKGRELQSESGMTIAAETPNGTLALGIEGAKRLQPLGRYIVGIGDFVPRGSVLAPGVEEADTQIRPGDEVIVVGSKAFGVGRARMSGWEMTRCKRGMAVDLRWIEKV